MEQLVVGIILFIVVLGIVVWVVRLKRSDKRINVPEEVSFLSSLEVRVVQDHQSESHSSLVQFRGMLPVYSATKLAFVVSVFTKDKYGKVEPVLSAIDTYQKPRSTFFQDLTHIGIVHKNTGSKDWSSIGTIPTEVLQPAFGGRQELKVHTMLIDVDNPPKDFDEKGIVFISSDYEHTFNVKGYHEEGDHINEARALSVKLGVAVAFSDEVFHKEEGVALNHWINKMITPYNREKKIQLKGVYDSALKEACRLAEIKDLDWENICKRLYEIGEEAQNYEALELVHEIMIADQAEHPQETEIIKKISILLGINDKELDYIRQHKISKLDKPLVKIE